ncbi:MAG: Na+/H+ antiporter NhaC family protein [Spirochaetes bacterium]|nr:Na+/H+ antiporter NhaC family protein [Spirochaetota bacterium]
MENENVKASGFALIPFMSFIAIFLGAGIILERQGVAMAFYQFPAPVAVLIGVILAFIVLKGTIADKMKTFFKGCGDENIQVMCMIFLLAGAFDFVATASGGRSSLVYLGLTFVPPHFMAAGIFLLCCFMSISIGTSMGTIAALGPIALGIASAAGLNLPLMAAAVVGGAMFGDNLGIISDTTIAATRGLGVQMRDKFRMNLVIAVPAAVITVILLLIFGRPETAYPVELGDFNVIKVVPYVAILVAAIAGVNVFVVLVGGIAMAGIIGLSYGMFAQGLLTLAQTIYSGMLSMIAVFFTSLFIGGLAALTRKAGGLQFLVDSVQKTIKGPKSAELGIAGLISVTDAAVANNTVACIISAPIAKDLAYKYRVDPRRACSIMDIFCCVMQGALPYGAQILLIIGLSGGAVSAVQIIPLLWYQWLLGAFAILSIFVPYANHIMKKDPWDWDHKMESSLARKMKSEGKI